MAEKVKAYLTPEAIHLLNIPGLDLTEYETRVLFTLLLEGETSASDLATLANIPRTKVYDIANKLVTKELIKQTKGKTYVLMEGTFDLILAKVETAYKSFKQTVKEIQRVREKGYHGAIEHKVTRILTDMGVAIRAEMPAYNGRQIDVFAKSPSGLKICIDIKASEAPVSVHEIEALQDTKLETGAGLAILIYLKELTPLAKSSAERHNIRCVKFDDKIESVLKNLLHDSEGKILEIRENLVKYREHISSMDELKEKLENDLFKTRSLFEEQLRNHPELDSYSTNLKDLMTEFDDLYSLYAKTKDLYNESQVLYEKNRFEDVLESFAFLKNLHDKFQFSAEKFIEKLRTHESRLHSMIEKADIWSLYGLERNPFAILPPGEPKSIVDQTELMKRLQRNLEYVKAGHGPSIIMITGEWGSGKTHLLAYLAERINKGKYGKAIAAYAYASSDFAKLCEDLTKASIGNADIDEVFVFSSKRSFYDILDQSERLLRFLKEHKIENVFWLIDEFETISISEKMQMDTFLHQFRVLIDRILTRGGLSLIIACSEVAWQEIRKDYPAFASRLSVVLKLKAFDNIKDVRTLITHSIERVKLPVSDGRKSPEISDDALHLILEKTGGNPRNILHACREIFNHVVSQGIEVADERIAKKVLSSINVEL